MSEGALPRLTELAHWLVARALRAGEMAVDATVGNGQDTELLARLAGPAGRVVGFDVQEEAVEATRRRLAGIGGLSEIELHCESHAAMAERVPAGVAVVMFNLGYLPGGDHAVITKTGETLAALDAAWLLLRAGGLITVVCYPGHAGGDEEARAVTGWAEGLGATANVVRYGILGTKSPAPVLLAVERQGGTNVKRATSNVESNRVGDGGVRPHAGGSASPRTEITNAGDGVPPA